MAKSSAARAAEEQVEEHQEVATRRDQLPAEVLAELERDAGGGISTAAEDNLVPQMYILQAQSPQVLKRNPAYIEGAEAGMIWLRNAPEPLVPGEEGMDFQPCYFERNVVEWVPRNAGGGFVARHEFRPEEEGEDAFRKLCERMEAREVPDPENDQRVKWVLANGNELVDTRYHMGYVWRPSRGPEPFVMPLKGTGHTFSRRWTSAMKGIVTRNSEGKMFVLASWGQLWRIKTRFNSRTSGDWFMYEAENGRNIVEVHGFDAYVLGKALHDAFLKGQKRVGAEEDMGAEGSGSLAEAHI